MRVDKENDGIKLTLNYSSKLAMQVAPFAAVHHVLQNLLYVKYRSKSLIIR